MVRFIDKHGKTEDKILVPDVFITDTGVAEWMVRKTNGQWWIVGRINAAGRLVREYRIPSDIGLDVDDEGRIKLEDE